MRTQDASCWRPVQHQDRHAATMLLLGDMVLFEATFVTEAAFEAGCFWFGVFFIAADALVVVVVIIVVWYSFCYCTGRRRGSSIIQ